MRSGVVNVQRLVRYGIRKTFKIIYRFVVSLEVVHGFNHTYVGTIINLIDNSY